ncbi:uncharacterized protein LOC134965400 [Pseudophryne corroboree]|uniref:uncharacterized protein LOC134965400 n=1 Tax=Pseudophryne corroboree TaxID=495146 RepID=UPI0030814584
MRNELLSMAGFYCEEGTVLPKPCPANTVRGSPGGRQREDCGPCPLGHWCIEASRFCTCVSLPSDGNDKKNKEIARCHDRKKIESRKAFRGVSLPFSGSGTIVYGDYPCPPGYWCPGMSDPLACPAGTLRTEPGAASVQDCEHCPAGYYCPDPTVTLEANTMGIPCRPGYECPPGAISEFTCRAGSYCASRTGIPPLCPGGYFCPEGSSTYNTSAQLCVFPYYCPPGSAYMMSCTGGTAAVPLTTLRDSGETSCRKCEAGTYRSASATDSECRPCPAGYSCPAGVESYQLYPCRAGYYCPSSATAPVPCPPGTYGNSTQGREPGDCHLCPAGTYNHLSAQVSCFLCGSFSYSEPGARSCVCRGVKRSFQESDGSCICQAGFVFYDDREKQRSDSNSYLDCQPQVEERCSSVTVRLASTKKCVTPEHHDCTPYCGTPGGTLSAELGICNVGCSQLSRGCSQLTRGVFSGVLFVLRRCHCLQYVAAEELCDRSCLMKAPRVSMTFGPNLQFLLQIEESEKRRSRKVEVVNVLGPDQHVWSSEQVHLALFGPAGVYGVILSSAQVIEAFLTVGSWSVPTPRKARDGNQGATWANTGSLPRIPNPILCLRRGDVVLFQLSVPPNERVSGHYPVYQKDHLYNTNPHWDFGAFRRLDHLIRETNVNVSRFAHVFGDPGTYVFVDNGIRDRSLFVTVKENNVCDPAMSHVQPSSPSQLIKQGIITQYKLNLVPNWPVIIGVLLLLLLVMVALILLSVVLRPSLYSPSPLQSWKPRWRSLGEPYIPPEHVLTRDSLQFYQAIGCHGSGERLDTGEKEIAYGLDQRGTARDLEDFSVRTLFDKLEDQTLHMTSQLGRHRNETLSFYKAFIHRIQVLKEMLQSLELGASKGFERRKIPLEGEKENTGTAITSQQSEGSGTNMSGTFYTDLPQDVTTVIGLIKDGDESTYRREVDRLAQWCIHNNLELNLLKTVETIVDFKKKSSSAPLLTIADSVVSLVDSFKFLGTTISRDLKWGSNADATDGKAQQRLFFIRHLRKFNIPQKLLLLFDFRGRRREPHTVTWPSGALPLGGSVEGTSSGAAVSCRHLGPLGPPGIGGVGRSPEAVLEGTPSRHRDPGTHIATRSGRSTSCRKETSGTPPYAANRPLPFPVSAGPCPCTSSYCGTAGLSLAPDTAS